MRKSAAHLSWEEVDEAGLRAGIAAIERRDRRKGQVVEQEPREPSGSEIRMTGEGALIAQDLLKAAAEGKTAQFAVQDMSGTLHILEVSGVAKSRAARRGRRHLPTAKRKTSVAKPDDTLSAHAPDKD